MHSWTHTHTLTTETRGGRRTTVGYICFYYVGPGDRSRDRALSDPSHWPALELLILLPPPPRFWDDRCALPRSGIQEWFARARKQSKAWLPPAPETARHEHWTHLWHFEKMEPNKFWLQILSDSFESIKNTVNVSENLPQYIVLPRGKFVKSV